MPSGRSETAVLLMAHGTPQSVDQMADYLRLVRGGREPSAELVEEMTHNWEAIGGRSPLTDITLQQGRELQQQLIADGFGVPVAVGMRNWRPFIAEPCQNRRVRLKAVSSPLARSFQLSVQKYMDAANAALPPGVEFSCVRSFHDHPLLIEAFAERVLAAQPEPDEAVVFTAHSLPVRVVTAGDPYPQQVAATAQLVAARCRIGRYETAYQSAGRTPEPWLGPDLTDFVRFAPLTESPRLVGPIGFVCDHTILFDVM